jgi:hypothetical protein
VSTPIQASNVHDQLFTLNQSALQHSHSGPAFDISLPHGQANVTISETTIDPQAGLLTVSCGLMYKKQIALSSHLLKESLPPSGFSRCRPIPNRSRMSEFSTNDPAKRANVLIILQDVMAILHIPLSQIIQRRTALLQSGRSFGTTD